MGEAVSPVRTRLGTTVNSNIWINKTPYTIAYGRTHPIVMCLVAIPRILYVTFHKKTTISCQSNCKKINLIIEKNQLKNSTRYSRG